MIDKIQKQIFKVVLLLHSRVPFVDMVDEILRLRELFEEISPVDLSVYSMMMEAEV